MTFAPNREELAWAAGFFDGEGHTRKKHTFCIQKSGRRSDSYGVSIEINQSHLEVLERFREAVGGLGAINGPYGPYDSRPTTKPHWTYRVNRFEHSQAVLAMLWTFLGSIKREQAAEAMRSYLRS